MPRVNTWLVCTIYEAYSAWHVSKIDMWRHLIGPRIGIFQQGNSLKVRMNGPPH
jgi:hypothetical protein